MTNTYSRVAQQVRASDLCKYSLRGKAVTVRVSSRADVGSNPTTCPKSEGWWFKSTHENQHTRNSMHQQFDSLLPI